MRHDPQKERAYAKELTDDEHCELADILNGLQGMALVSGYPSPLYDRLYAGWRCEKFSVFADGGVSRVEALWISPKAEASLEAARLEQERQRAQALRKAKPMPLFELGA